MRKAGKPIAVDTEMSMVDHLDELRDRLIISAIVLVAAFALCFAFNHEILAILNTPIPEGKEPTTFGVSEAFMTTVSISMWAALLISLPLILWELYAFLAPVVSPDQRRVAAPLLLMVPVLFVAGVVFSFFVVLPAAVNFLLNFNDDQFNILVRAKDYYGFAAMTLASMGILFQMPVVAIGASRLGVTTPEQMRRSRRTAIVAIAVVAMLLPGTDPVSMVISMVPLVILYESSIVLASIFGRPSRAIAPSAA
ncbi:MAG: twin-arginine translocase subunit TatC [Solirubrobacterales bacterium]